MHNGRRVFRRERKDDFPVLVGALFHGRFDGLGGLGVLVEVVGAADRGQAYTIAADEPDAHARAPEAPRQFVAEQRGDGVGVSALLRRVEQFERLPQVELLACLLEALLPPEERLETRASKRDPQERLVEVGIGTRRDDDGARALDPSVGDERRREHTVLRLRAVYARSIGQGQCLDQPRRRTPGRGPFGGSARDALELPERFTDDRVWPGLVMEVRRGYAMASVLRLRKVNHPRDRAGEPADLAEVALKEALEFAGGACGGLLGGYLSDKVGRRRIILLSLILSVPFFYLFLLSTGVLAAVGLGLAGFFLMSSIPVVLVMSQEIMPGRVGMVSGLMMGFGWGIGGLCVALVGMLADSVGLTSALALVGGFPLIGFACGLLLPRR